MYDYIAFLCFTLLSFYCLFTSVFSAQDWHENINDIISTIYNHDSIVIFSSENIMIFYIYFYIFKISTFIIIIYLLFYYLCISNANCPSL